MTAKKTHFALDYNLEVINETTELTAYFQTLAYSWALRLFTCMKYEYEYMWYEIRT